MQDCATLRQNIVDQALNLLFIDLRDLEFSIPQLLHETPVEKGKALVHNVPIEFFLVIRLHSLIVYCKKTRIQF